MIVDNICKTRIEMENEAIQIHKVPKKRQAYIVTAYLK